MSFEAKPKSIMGLFREPEGISYNIPMYQRSYSWGEDEISDFCEDLNDLYTGNGKDYFFGALITMEDKYNQNNQQVIDGQQRITTFSILISQLYNLCEVLIDQMEKSDKLKYKQNIKELRNKQGDLGQCIKNENKYKVILSKVDNEYFEKVLDISTEKELIDICYEIVDKLELSECIETDIEYKNAYIKKIHKKKKITYKDILNIPAINNSIRFKDLKDICYEQYKSQLDLKSNYNYKMFEKYLLIKYIRDILSKTGKSINYYLEKKYITDEDIHKVNELLDFEYEKLDIVSHKNIKNAKEIISEKIIKTILDLEILDDKVYRLLRFIDIFIHKTYVVKISSTDQESVYTMFQVLNDRSKALGVIELLRPYTLQLLEENENYQSKVSKLWDELSKKIDCEIYMKVYLASYIVISRMETKIHNKYKEIFFSERYSALNIYENVNKIYYMQNIYSYIIDGEWPYKNSNIDYYVKYRFYNIIKVLGYKGIIPLLLAVYEIGEEDDFIYTIDVIERVVFRYITICGKKPSKLTDIYNDSIKKMRNSNYFNKQEFKDKMDSLLNEDGCDLNTFKDKIDCDKLKYKNSGNNKIIKYFLSTLEYYYTNYYDMCTNKNLKYKVLDRPMKSVINYNIIEIEHIYPKKAKLQDDELEPIKNNIGNLTILEKKLNIDASNNKFEDKQNEYSKEAIKITKLLDGKEKINNKYDEVKTWNFNEYNRRLDLYRDIASKIYTLYGN